MPYNSQLLVFHACNVLSCITHAAMVDVAFDENMHAAPRVATEAS